MSAAIKDLIKYWRNSVADAGRLSPKSKVLQNARSKGFTMSRAAFAAGRLDRTVTDKLFQEGSKKRPARAGAATDSARGGRTTMPVLLCPLVFVVEHEHGVARHSKDRSVHHAPVCIAATLARDGRLIAASTDAKPQINRDFLEPSHLDLTIGTIDDADDFYNRHDPPEGSWSRTVNYARKLVQQVSKRDFDTLMIEGTARLEHGLVLATDKPTEVRSILDGYDRLHKAGKPPALLRRLIDGAQDRKLLNQAAIFPCHLRHVGQMKNAFPLTPSQRDSLAHFLAAKIDAAEILAVNGPPGTGKTTLIQSVVATLWVHAAHERQPCPVIVATAATNQAATNIIREFNSVKSSDSDKLSNRWLADVTSLGMFMAAQSADTEGWQIYANEKNHFARDTIETLDGFERNRDFFLQQFCAAFSDRPVDNLTKARDVLHAKLEKVVKGMRAVVKLVRRLVELTDGRPFSLGSCADQMYDLRNNSEYGQRFEDFAEFCTKRKIDGTLDSVWGWLDRHERHQAFLLAMHYWEATYLLEVEADLAEDYEDKKSADKLLRQYRRLAKIAPCFVVTLHTLPKRFTGWRGEEEPMTDAIDLLVIDEAGQAAPDIAALSFAFAKRALVVGDLKQISPIWPIVAAIDKANVAKFIKLDDTRYEEFCAQGRSASSGTIMAMAQRASQYTKFRKFGGGMFLSEHFRCQGDIIAYCNKLSYQDQLKPCRPDDLQAPHPLPAMGFAHIDGDDRELGGSRENVQEAQVIATWIAERQEQLADYYHTDTAEIGALLAIVTPFAAQARIIRSELGKQHLPVATRDQAGITVGTLHSLQGAERKIILFSPTYGRSHRGGTFFGRDERMLNVAVSRAQDSFLVFGNMRLFGPRVRDRPSALLGKFILHPDQEITDVPPVLPVKEAPPPPSTLIRDVEGHRQALRTAFAMAKDRMMIVSPFLTAAALEADEIEAQIRDTTVRGVNVYVCTDPQLNRSKQSEFNTCVAKLRAAGAKIYIPRDVGIHSKLLWADRQFLAVGSFNWLSAMRTQREYQRYEVSAVYHSDSAAPLIQDLGKDLYKSTRLQE